MGWLRKYRTAVFAEGPPVVLPPPFPCVVLGRCLTGGGDRDCPYWGFLSMTLTAYIAVACLRPAVLLPIGNALGKELPGQPGRVAASRDGAGHRGWRPWSPEGSSSVR